jgi:hypothetical protein
MFGDGAMIWIVRRFDCGKYTASNSTFDSIKLEATVAPDDVWSVRLKIDQVPSREKHLAPL